MNATMVYRQEVVVIERDEQREAPAAASVPEFDRREWTMIGVTTGVTVLFLAAVGAYVWVGTLYGFHNFR